MKVKELINKLSTIDKDTNIKITVSFTDGTIGEIPLEYKYVKYTKGAKTLIIDLHGLYE